MNKIFLIAKREVGERLITRSYLSLMVIGPLVVLGLLYIFLASTSAKKQSWDVLVMDVNQLFEYKLSSKEDPLFEVDFINAFVDYDEFAEGEKFQEYDLLVWINEKVITNKNVIISYREKPSQVVQRRLVYQIERRLEEVMVEQFTSLSIKDFRSIKQPLQISLKDAYDPKDERMESSGWVGFVFGAMIIFFILSFGMTMLRGVAKEKSNRIVEVLLSSVSPRQLLTGKILGIGFSAFLQFVVWVFLVGIGLWMLRVSFFPDLLDPAMVASELGGGANEVNNLKAQSPFVQLVYNQIQYLNMLIFFALFFIAGFLFYGAFFAMIGASVGSESDGQQFVIPVVMLLLIAVIAGYYEIYYPDTLLSEWLGFIPFTAPAVMMVELSYGFADGSAWKLYLSLLILIISAIILLILAARIYKNGILQFGHRLRLPILLRWLRK
jgi:ABC-2 type transport system permease protein